MKGVRVFVCDDLAHCSTVQMGHVRVSCGAWVNSAPFRDVGGKQGQ